jgi:hypothetical protein
MAHDSVCNVNTKAEGLNVSVHTSGPVDPAYAPPPHH